MNDLSLLYVFLVSIYEKSTSNPYLFPFFNKLTTIRNCIPMTPPLRCPYLQDVGDQVYTMTTTKKNNQESRVIKAVRGKAAHIVYMRPMRACKIELIKEHNQDAEI